MTQDRLFKAPAEPPPDFDELCPPDEEQLALDVDTAAAAARQTTVYDFDA